MKYVRLHTLATLVLIATAMTSSGCQWLAPQSSHYDLDVDNVDAETLREEYRNIDDHARQLESQLEEQEHELVQRSIALENEREKNRLLRAELDATLIDLRYLESQFITLERQLTQEESRASAAAAMADAQLLYDRLRASDDGTFDEKEWQEVERRMSSADDAMTMQNYTAAVYHAHRAVRLLNRSQRESESFLSSGTARVVLVPTANLREGPGTGFKVLTRLVQGTVIVEVAGNDEWRRVKMKSGRGGWIHASLIR